MFVYLGRGQSGEVVADRFSGFEYKIDPETGEAKLPGLLSPGKKECDFVVCSQNKIKKLMQVCLSMEDENTQKREFEGLVDAMKTYGCDDGVILTLSESDEINYRADGHVYKIKTLPVWQFLLEKY